MIIANFTDIGWLFRSAYETIQKFFHVSVSLVFTKLIWKDVQISHSSMTKLSLVETVNIKWKEKMKEIKKLYQTCIGVNDLVLTPAISSIFVQANFYLKIRVSVSPMLPSLSSPT